MTAHAADRMSWLPFGVELVVFDLDGTLYDDRVYLAEVDRTLARHLCVAHRISDEVATRAVADATSGGRHGFLNRMCDDLVLDPAAISEMLKVMRAVEPELEPFPWVGAVLRALRDNKVRVFVLTNGNRDQQRRKLDSLGLSTTLEPGTVVYAAEGRPKPDPEGLLQILRTTDIPAARSLFIGDHRVDQECAAAAAVHFWYVAELVARTAGFIADAPPGRAVEARGVAEGA